MDNVMRGIPAGGWLKIVGPDFEAGFLDTPALRKRSASMPAYLQRPAVRKLQTPDGRKYKLLHVPPGNDRIRQIQRYLKPIRHEPFLPRLLWSDSNSLLFEFIEGEFADITTEQFAHDFGLVQARIHQYRCRNIGRLRYRLEFSSALKVLSRHDVVRSGYLDQARVLYRELEPRRILRSLDYVDITHDNFVYDRDGHLRLIDAGSFQDNRAMGQFLVGSPFFHMLNAEAFWNSYLSTGTAPFPFEHQRFLQLFHYVMKAGQKARIYATHLDKTSNDARQHWHRLVRHRNRLVSFLNRSA